MTFWHLRTLASNNFDFSRLTERQQVSYAKAHTSGTNNPLKASPFRVDHFLADTKANVNIADPQTFMEGEDKASLDSTAAYASASLMDEEEFFPTFNYVVPELKIFYSLTEKIFYERHKLAKNISKLP